LPPEEDPLHGHPCENLKFKKIYVALFIIVCLNVRTRTTTLKHKLSLADRILTQLQEVEKLLVAKGVTKFHPFYVTPLFTTIFTKRNLPWNISSPG
jgi:hypothetical protein